MSSLPKAVYPFGSEKGEPILADVLGVRAGIQITLAPGESRTLEFLPENKTVSFPNVVQFWSTGVAQIATATPEKFGKFIVREINFDDKPLLPEDLVPSGSNGSWISTTTLPISGTTSYTNPYTTPSGNDRWTELGLIIPAEYIPDAQAKPNAPWRQSWDWTFTPGVVPEDVYCQLFPIIGGGSAPAAVHDSPWSSGPKVAANGHVDAPVWAEGYFSPLYGPLASIAYLGETPPSGMPFGGVYRIDNILLYTVGEGPNPNRTNLHFLIPNRVQLLQVGDEVVITNPLPPADPPTAEGAITIICNQVTRWSQVVNPGTYGAST